MLIRFSVENFLSFRDEIEFSMIPGKTRKHPEHVVSNGKRSDVAVLRSAVIYGANASGKSNLIKAMDFAHDLIVTGKRPGEVIPVKPFRFDRAYLDKPSKFQFEFKHESKAFIYGFIVDAQKVHEEWLYEITPSTEKPIFERTTNAQDKVEVEFHIKPENAKERDFLDFTAMGTRPNQLLLTESIERNIKHFEDVFDWFNKRLVIVFPRSTARYLEWRFMNREDFKKSFQEVFQSFDTGITDISLRESDFDHEVALPNDLIDHIKEGLHSGLSNKSLAVIGSPDGKRYSVFKDEQGDIKVLKLMTGHKLKGENESVLLEVSEESDGTQRLFDLIPALMDLINTERVFVIDELDRSMHPHLSRQILELFLTHQPPQNSQLIATTHESHLLDLDLLRRDEIWFIEKDKDGASAVYSLEEFAPRYDKDIRKGYLLGRFGAIPFLKNLPQLG